MKEKDLENYIIDNPVVIEDGLTFVGQQQRVSGKLVDILFESKRGEVVIVEVKQIATRKDIAQLFDYAGYFIERSTKPVRVIFIAFRIPKNFKNSFDYFGIEHIEITEDQVRQAIAEKQPVNTDQHVEDSHAHLGELRESNHAHEANSSISNRRIESASHIIKLLNSAERGFTMKEITKHMRGYGFTSRSFYDACNALADSGAISKQKYGRTYTYSSRGITATPLDINLGVVRSKLTEIADEFESYSLLDEISVLKTEVRLYYKGRHFLSGYKSRKAVYWIACKQRDITDDSVECLKTIGNVSSGHYFDTPYVCVEVNELNKMKSVLECIDFV